MPQINGQAKKKNGLLFTVSFTDRFVPIYVPQWLAPSRRPWGYPKYFNTLRKCLIKMVLTHEYTQRSSN